MGKVRSSVLRSQLPIGLILGLSVTLNSAGITWGLPNYVDWAADSIVPFDMLRAAYFRFSKGWADIYPPLPYAVLAVLSAPLMGYLALSGGLQSPSPIFPFGLADPLATLTNIILIARALSMLLGVGIVFVVYLTVKEIFDRRAALFSALIVALYYPLIYYAHNANVEVPYLFWSLLAIYFFVRILNDGQLRQYVLFALFGTLAICSKDQAYGLFLLSPLPLLWMRYSELAIVHGQRAGWRQAFYDKRLLWAALVSVGTFVVAQNLLFNFSGFVSHVQLITGRASVPYAAFEPTLWGRLQLFWETLSQLAAGLTLPVFVICLIGSVYCAVRSPGRSLPVLFLAASYYLTFINVVSYVPLRFVLPIGIIVAFFGGKLLAETWRPGALQIWRRAAVCFVLAYAGLFAIQLDLLLVNDPRYGAEKWLRENVEDGAIIETFAPRVTSLKHYPRFSIGSKVRSSVLAAGTQWEVRKTRPDQTLLPNIYEGGGPPDYVVLSNYWYREWFVPGADNSEPERVLSDFFEGRAGYDLVATFETPTLVPISGLPINPRIDFFARSNQAR